MVPFQLSQWRTRPEWSPGPQTLSPDKRPSTLLIKWGKFSSDKSGRSWQSIHIYTETDNFAGRPLKPIQTNTQGQNQCSGFGSFCPDPDLTFLPESGSELGKKSRSDPENPDPWKNAQKLVSTSKKKLLSIFSNLRSILFGQVSLKPNQRTSFSFHYFHKKKKLKISTHFLWYF